MRIGGAIWDNEPINSGIGQPRGGWELVSAQSVAARACEELARLRTSSADASDLECAERRYRRALSLLGRIRTSLNDSSTAG